MPILKDRVNTKDKMNPKDKADKVFYRKLFGNLFADTFTLKLWDGEEIVYGEGESRFTVTIKEPLPISYMIASPSITFGEAYMNKQVEIEGNVQEVIESLYRNPDSFLRKKGKYNRILNPVKNNLKNSKNNITHHYDIGNDFYRLWLDPTMTYSCGYFKSREDSLEQAQQNKTEHILKKLNLREGQTLLDIGCGWGQLMLRAAKEYQVKVLGITLSQEQLEAVQDRIKQEKLEHLAKVELRDYRDMEKYRFDRIVSVGMIEHVGKEYLEEYFQIINKLLKRGSVSLLHCITSLKGGNDPWINKYIFPGGYIPAVKELVSYMAEQGFHLLDMESLRRHYGKTLEHWAANFERALPEIAKTKDEAFIRMWRLYLNSCAASFNCGNIDIHQFLFSKGLANDIPWTRDYLY